MTVMHNIQRRILQKLLYAESLGYAEMRPEGVESNHFAYHLERLVRMGIIRKNDRRYTLSPLGLSVVDRLSQEKMVDRTQPQINTCIDVATADGQTLLFRRNFQPYIFRLGFPTGKTHLEETITEAAVRELQEKTGLTNIPLTHRGIVYVTIMREGVVVSKILYHLFQGRVLRPLPTTSSMRGESLWMDTSRLKEESVLPGFLHVKGLFASDKKSIFEEITIEW